MPASTPPAEREGLLAAQYENMLRCIRCGLCLSVCPTYQQTFDESESPRGRIAMTRALVEGHLDFSADLWEHQASCLLCEACTAICPSGVRMEDIGVAVRASLRPELRPSPLASALRRLVFDGLFADMANLRRAAGLARLLRSSGLATVAERTGLLNRLGLSRLQALLPAMRAGFVIPKGQRWPPHGVLRRRVALFAGCAMSTAFSGVTQATLRALVANGCLVIAPKGQGCCGALHLHEGELDGARELARRNVEAFRAPDIDAIVVNAAGCGAALKHYGRLLADDARYARRAADFAAKVKDVHELLVSDGLRPPGRLDVRVTYQEPCHLAHAQGIREAPRSILRAIPGLRLIEMDEPTMCCGSAGIYNVTHPQMADELLRRKVASVLATGAEIVASANPGCMLQLEAGLRASGARVAVKHVIELLDEAYRVGDPAEA